MSAALSLVSRQAAAVGLDLCGSGYCDRPAVVWVVRYQGRVSYTRAGQWTALGSREPRCRDCAHHELDMALERT